MDINVLNALSTNLDGELKDAIQEVINQESQFHSEGELLLSLCQIFISRVEISKRDALVFGKYQTTLYSHKVKPNTSTSSSNLMVYAARLVYSIRKFLNSGEEIIFHFGATGPDGHLLAEGYVPQTDVLANFKSVTRKSIGITSASWLSLLEKEDIEHEGESFLEQWNRVLDLTTINGQSSYDLTKAETIKTNSKTGEAIVAYQKKTADTNIYIREAGANKTNYIKYYHLNDAFIYFNNGWLWQWFDSIYNSDNEAKQSAVKSALDQGSIEPIISEKDYIPGTKQGDYQNVKKQQIQNKYNNEKIITYNNILKIMYEFTSALQLFLANNTDKNLAQNLTSLLREHFIPEVSRKVDEEIDEITDEELLSKLSIAVAK